MNEARVFCSPEARLGSIGSRARESERSTRPNCDSLPGGALTPLQAQAHWMEFLTRNILLFTLTQSLSKDRNFQVSGRCRTVGEVTAGRVITHSGKCQLFRGPHEIKIEPSARYAVFMSLRGEFAVSQFGRTEMCRPSQAVMLSGAEELVHCKHGDNDTVCLLLQEEFVEERVANISARCARPLHSREGLGRLFFSTLAAFPDAAISMTDVEFQAAANLIGDLFLLALGGCDDVAAQAQSVRAANLARIKRAIKKRLHELDLSLEDIAAECGISLSYLHNLFREDDLSAWEFLKSERLQRARQMMTATNTASKSVTDIAISCGFSNMSQFSTAFKRAFSVSPSQVLHARRRIIPARSNSTPPAPCAAG